MRHAPAALALLLAAGCAKPLCQVPTAGACQSDSDCTFASCRDVDCPSQCGVPVAKSQLGAEACLVERGQPDPSSCHESLLPHRAACPAIAELCMPLAVCQGGRCAAASYPDGGL